MRQTADVAPATARSALVTCAQYTEFTGPAAVQWGVEKTEVSPSNFIFAAMEVTG